ncbi:hypothetical protein chiPu_0028203 [Chiloscyllium punctatum]|uniref:Claudin n=1 Tax=Chiloscyllium punctatum TaxID=137246 RepID=A0A401TNE4_CHIPU|nr:hypothetical protein [Chiloscyllium punctatum]
MERTVMRGLGFGLVLLGLVGTIVSCALPLWLLSLPPGPANSTLGGPSRQVWEGLWVCCWERPPEAGSRCEAYPSPWSLPLAVQAARALTLIAAALGLLGALAGAASALVCAPLLRDPVHQGDAGVCGGFLALAAGTLELLAVGWVVHSARRDRGDPLVALDAQREAGPASHLALAAGAALALGGILLCLAWPKQSDRYPPKLQSAASTAEKPARA